MLTEDEEMIDKENKLIFLRIKNISLCVCMFGCERGKDKGN